MSIRKLSSILLVSMLFFGASLAQAADYKTKLTLTIANSGPVYDEAYLLTVPSDTAITQSGWNSLGNITVSYGGNNAGFDPSKRLVVSATSANGFKLTASETDETISYFVATGEEDTSATTTFKFMAAEINASGGTSKPIGVNVEDYSSKPNGTYEDEITYEVSIENTTTTIVTWTASDTWNVDTSGEVMTKDGVTVTAGMVNPNNHNIMSDGTFTTNSGIFTKIEVTASSVGASGDGWSDDGWSGNVKKKTWTGNAASVSFTGNILDSGNGTLQIVFTIEE